MRIRIIAVGKIREPYLQEGIREYLKRLGPYYRIDTVEVSEERVPDVRKNSGMDQIRSREATRILGAIPEGSVVLALDPAGETWTSEDLARFLSDKNMEGVPVVTFVLGGPKGLPPRVLDMAMHTVSLSRMTFPHQMARLLLVEQIYRAAKIVNGEPYHK